MLHKLQCRENCDAEQAAVQKENALQKKRAMQKQLQCRTKMHRRKNSNAEEICDAEQTAMQKNLLCRNELFSVVMEMLAAVAPSLNIPKPLLPQSRKLKLKLKPKQ